MPWGLEVRWVEAVRTSPAYLPCLPARQPVRRQHEAVLRRSTLLQGHLAAAGCLASSHTFPSVCLLQASLGYVLLTLIIWRTQLAWAREQAAERDWTGAQRQQQRGQAAAEQE